MKILIIQLKQLGDVLLSTPVAENIKYFYPKATLHFLTSPKAEEIVKDNPFIDKVLILKDGIPNEIKTIKKIRNENYDAILDIQRTGRSKRITFLSNAKIRAAFKEKNNLFFYNVEITKTTHGYTAFERLDILKAIGINKPNRVMPKLFFSKETENRVLNYLKARNISNYFIVSPTARKPTKMWDAEEFGKLANILSKDLNLKAVIVYGTKSERVIAEQCASFIEDPFVIEEPLPIKDFAALVKNAIFSVGNDSFASHVAVSQNTKTIVICGPTSGWFLENENTLLIYKGLNCQPCNNPDKCPYDFACYKTLKHTEIAERVLNFIKNSNPQSKPLARV